MKNILKKTIATLILVFILTGVTTPIYYTFAYEPTDYVLLSPLPGVGEKEKFDPSTPGALGAYLNDLIPLFIGICAVLAVIMIVMGGIQYMTSELIPSKEAAKGKIINAMLGLLLALGAWVILYTINPNILDISLSTLKKVEVTVTELDAIKGKVTTVNGTQVNACDESQLVTMGFLGHSVRVNKAVVPALLNVDNLWKAMGENYFYPVTSVGGYNCREVKNKPGYWSMHAFGLAIDINPSTNPYNQTTLKTDMPASFVALFTSAGWGWGGNWSSPKDPMHFSSTNK